MIQLPNAEYAALVAERDSLLVVKSELLKALEESIKQVEWWQSNHGCCAGVSDEWFAKARAAISKARGEA